MYFPSLNGKIYKTKLKKFNYKHLRNTLLHSMDSKDVIQIKEIEIENKYSRYPQKIISTYYISQFFIYKSRNTNDNIRIF